MVIHVVSMYLSDIGINDDDDDGNRQALEQQTSLELMMRMFHKTVLKNLEDDKECSFVEEKVEWYEYSFEQLV